MADLGEGPRGGRPLPLLSWVKKEEMTEGRKAGWASKKEPGPSKSGSATISIAFSSLCVDYFLWGYFAVGFL